MGPLEILWLAIVVFFVLIAFVRGYPRELGVTTVIFGALFLITFFLEKYLPRFINFLSSELSLQLTERQLQHFYALFYSLLFLVVVFWAYAGETFSFQGKEHKGACGFVLNFLVGLLNGVLVASTLWYFQVAYNYPVADFKNAAGQSVFLTLPLTSFAQSLVTYVPANVIPPIFWGAMLLLMLIARVRK